MIATTRDHHTPLSWFLHWYRQAPERIFLSQPVDRQWQAFSFADVHQQAQQVASGLRALGLAPGDCVALLSKNCAYWIITDLALQLGGFVSVPLYVDQTEEQLEYILEDANVKAVVIGKMELAQWQRYHARLSKVPITLYMPFMGEAGDYQKAQVGVNAYSWHAICELGAQQPVDFDLPDLDDLWTILYTSGTSGVPKGVAHRYRGVSESRVALASTFNFTTDDQFFSYLPLAHAAERMLLEVNALFFGVPIAFTESLESFQEDLACIRPTLFFSVPRIWKKLQLGILANLPQQKMNWLLALPWLNRLIQRKVKRALGLDRARIVMSGAAPIAEEMLHWFKRLDILILEGYGLTENFAFGCVNTRRDYKLGSIGKPLPGAGFRLGDDNEVQFKSALVMAEYYQQPELSQAAFTHDGYLRTGDKAEVDADGFVFLKGRIKDIFKTAKGEYVAPLRIENRLQAYPLLEHVCVIGSGLAQPIAVVTGSKLTNSSQVQQQLGEILNNVNDELLNHEKLAKIVVYPEDWTVDNGLMTPTLKIKRHALEQRLAANASHYLDNPEAVVFLQAQQHKA